MAGMLSMEMLPEDCVSTILSLTTPADAGKLSLVSSAFRSAAESDVVWGRFLPENYAGIMADSDISGDALFCSKREIFFRFCSPILLDGGKRSLELEKYSGKICYTLSARELGITWSSDPLCWSWKSHPQSRFEEVAELRTVSWLEIKGRIRTKELSPNTMYGAYLLVKITERAYGLDLMAAQVSIELIGIINKLNNVVSKGSVWLHQHEEDNNKKKHNYNYNYNYNLESLFYGNRRERVRDLMDDSNNKQTNYEIGGLKLRQDGWFEIELGQFFSGQNDEQLQMSLMEIKGFQLKAGLIVEGIQIRPI